MHLRSNLRKEVGFIQAYDSVAKAVDARFDVRGSDLSLLVRMCLDNRGKVSRTAASSFGTRLKITCLTISKSRRSSHLPVALSRTRSSKTEPGRRCRRYRC